MLIDSSLKRIDNVLFEVVRADKVKIYVISLFLKGYSEMLGAIVV